MRIFESKKVTVTKDVFVKMICDVCKKEIDTKKMHYDVTTGHREWGNDSIESVEHSDICSAKCLQEMVDWYLETGQETQYLEIERNVLRWIEE